MRSFLSWLSISSFPLVAQNEIECRDGERKELTGFSLAIDGGRLNATHFEKMLQSCVKYKARNKGVGGRAGGQTGKLGDVEAGAASGGEGCRPRAGKGREGNGTVEEKGKNLLKGWGWARDKCSDQACPKAYIAKRVQTDGEQSFPIRETSRQGQTLIKSSSRYLTRPLLLFPVGRTRGRAEGNVAQPRLGDFCKQRVRGLRARSFNGD